MFEYASFFSGFISMIQLVAPYLIEESHSERVVMFPLSGPVLQALTLKPNVVLSLSLSRCRF